MGRVAVVLSFEPESGKTPNVKGDPGGEATFTGEHYAPPGVDARPLPGDFFATHDGPGTGEEIVSGYHDPNDSNRKSEDGEHRAYARDADGNEVCEIWLKKNGEIVISSVAGDQPITINGVTIGTDGSITAPGEIQTEQNGGVTLSQHTHNTAMGPSGPPNPGT